MFFLLFPVEFPVCRGYQTYNRQKNKQSGLNVDISQGTDMLRVTFILLWRLCTRPFTKVAVTVTLSTVCPRLLSVVLSTSHSFCSNELDTLTNVNDNGYKSLSNPSVLPLTGNTKQYITPCCHFIFDSR